MYNALMYNDCSAVDQSNDILCEYNVRTAGQLASRVYDMFIAVEHWFLA